MLLFQQVTSVREFFSSLLERALFGLYDAWWRQLGYRAERFRQMFVPGCKRYFGGIRAVQHVLMKKTSGFGRLQGHPTLTVEHLVASGEWDHLIAPSFRAAALRRLGRHK